MPASATAICSIRFMGPPLPPHKMQPGESASSPHLIGRSGTLARVRRLERSQLADGVEACAGIARAGALLENFARPRVFAREVLGPERKRAALRGARVVDLAAVGTEERALRLAP